MKKFLVMIALLNLPSLAQAGKEIEPAPTPEKKVPQRINVPKKIHGTYPVMVLKSRKNGSSTFLYKVMPQQ